MAGVLGLGGGMPDEPEPAGSREIAVGSVTRTDPVRSTIPIPASFGHDPVRDIPGPADAGSRPAGPGGELATRPGFLAEVLATLDDRCPAADAAEVSSARRQTHSALRWWLRKIPDLTEDQVRRLAPVLYDDKLAVVRETQELTRTFSRARRLRAERYPDLVPGPGEGWNPILRSIDPDLDRILEDGHERKMNQFRSVRSILNPRQIECLDRIGACAIK